MKKILLALILGVAVLAAPSTVRADIILLSSMDGADETPPNDSPGLGVAIVTINDAMDTLTYFVTFDDLQTQAISAHIHVGDPGNPGPISFGFPNVPADTSGFMVGTLTADDFQPGGGLETFDDAVQALLNGAMYTNVHSTTVTAGEIRGQIYVFSE